MAVVINGDTGISGVDGSAATPAVQGSDTNTGVFYGTDIVAMSTNGTERMRIDSSGNVLVTNPAGLGYGTGSGGTVTQGSGSGKSTAVTINTPTGRITMNNAALGAGASASFTVNNSLVAINDTVLCQGSYSTIDTGNYRIEVQSIISGGFAVRVTNISGGSRSEAIVLNFAVIKGATS